METEQIAEKVTVTRKRPFKRRTMQVAPCCWCGKPTDCVHKTKQLKCWDCRMKMIKDYQHKHKSLQINEFNL
jgi:hypothetical protein